jgi:hypothetical protein
MTTIEKAGVYESSAIDETVVPTLKCTRLHNRRSRTLDYRLKKAGFIACDFDPNEHPRAWAVAVYTRDAVEAIVATDAFVSWKPRKGTIRPKARDKADRPLYIRVDEYAGSSTICIVCLNPLTGTIYIGFDDTINLSRIPFCVRNATKEGMAASAFSKLQMK